MWYILGCKLLDPDFAVLGAQASGDAAPQAGGAGAEAEAAADDESGSVDGSASSGGTFSLGTHHIV